MSCDVGEATEGLENELDVGKVKSLVNELSVGYELSKLRVGRGLMSIKIFGIVKFLGSI